MAQPDRVVVRALCAAIQTAEGTPASPTLLLNRLSTIGAVTLQINDLESGDVDGEQDGGMGSTRQEASSGRRVQFDYTIAFKGAAADYATAVGGVFPVPTSDVGLRTAGLVQVRSGAAGSGKLDYTTIDDGTFEYATYVAQTGRLKYTLTDCVTSNFKVMNESGKRTTITFTVVGLMPNDPVDAVLGTQSADAVNSPIWRGATSSAIGAFNVGAGLRLKKLTLDAGGAHTFPGHAGADDAIAAPVVTNRQFKADATIEKVALSAFNPFTLGRQAWPGGTSTAITTRIGAAQFNRITITTGQWGFRAPQGADNNGIIDWPLSGKLHKSIASGAGAGREILITFD